MLEPLIFFGCCGVGDGSARVKVGWRKSCWPPDATRSSVPNLYAVDSGEGSSQGEVDTAATFIFFFESICHHGRRLTSSIRLWEMATISHNLPFPTTGCCDGMFTKQIPGNALPCLSVCLTDGYFHPLCAEKPAARFAPKCIVVLLSRPYGRAVLDMPEMHVHDGHLVAVRVHR